MWIDLTCEDTEEVKHLSVIKVSKVRQTAAKANLLISPLLLLFFPVLVGAAVAVFQLLFLFVSLFLLRVSPFSVLTGKTEVQTERSEVRGAGVRRWLLIRQ